MWGLPILLFVVVVALIYLFWVFFPNRDKRVLKLSMSFCLMVLLSFFQIFFNMISEFLNNCSCSLFFFATFVVIDGSA